jgi:predicted O-methyltransferase YrrM
MRRLNTYYSSVRKTGRYYRDLLNVRWMQTSSPSVERVIAGALKFTEELKVNSTAFGRYRYAPSIAQPSLYASVFAALLRDLTGDLDRVSADDKMNWISYINSFQCDDGLFRDPITSNEIAEIEDWWGWRHLTLLCVMALTALGDKPRRRLAWLDKFAARDAVEGWLAGMDWGEKVDVTSNAVQNAVACMQFARDFMGEGWFATAIDDALQFLSKRCNKITGLWGSPPLTPEVLSRQVQAAYHFWLLYMYDSVTIPHRDRAIAQVLKTQSGLGGYNPALSLSSACEDIASIDPTVRFGLGSIRNHCVASINRALPWVLYNFNSDGGAVLRRDSAFIYGHPLLSSGPNESNIFATWFRMLSLALIDTVKPIQKVKWTFLNAPGYQFTPSHVFVSPRFSKMQEISTHLTDAEKRHLYNAARALAAGSVAVELGSYLGASACALAEGGQNRIKLFCVDTWLNDAMSEGSRNTYELFKENVIRYRNVITPIRGRSVEVGSQFRKPIDLLFVDADHSYEAVMADLAAWLPLLRPGGSLILHDSGWADGVQRAIREIVSSIQLEDADVLPNMYSARVTYPNSYVF